MLCRVGGGHRKFLLLPSQPSLRWFIHASISKMSAFARPQRAKGETSRPESQGRLTGNISRSLLAKGDTSRSESQRVIMENISRSPLAKGDTLRPLWDSQTVFTGRIPRSLLVKFQFETAKLLVVLEEMSGRTMDRDQILWHFRRTSPTVLRSFQKIYAFSQDMIKKSCPERIVHILHISHILGTVLAHNQYEQIVYQLGSHHHWETACRVSAMAEQHTGRWTTRLLNWHTLAVVELERYSHLDGVLDLFNRDGLKPTRRTYHNLVRGHLQNSDLVRAQSCLVTMQEAGFKIEGSTYATVVGAYRALGFNESVAELAFQTLQGGLASDTAILNGLMQLYVGEGNIASALKVSEMFTLSPPSNSETDGNGTGETSPSQTTPRIMPDNATFNILLAFLARNKDALPQVLRLFGQISAVGLRADEHAVAALIAAHFVSGMSGVAVAIVAEMTISQYPAVDPEAFRLLRRADSVGFDIVDTLTVRPTIHIFNVLLEGVLPTQGFMGMKRILQIMEQAAIAPDSSTVQIFISYLYDLRDERPKNLIRSLDNLPPAKLTIHHANTILRALLRRERDITRTKSWNATAQRVRFGHRSRFSMDALSQPAESFDPTAGIAPTSFTPFTTKILQPLVQSLSEKGVMSDKTTFALSIKRHAVTGMDMPSARRVFDIMVSRGIRPNAYHFGALLEGNTTQGNMEGAIQVLDEAVRSGIKPNVVMYTMLINGYGRLGRPDLALRTFNDMRSRGVPPNFAAIDAVVSAYWFVREYHLARNLLLELWPLVAKFPEEFADAPLLNLIKFFRTLRPTPPPIRVKDSPRRRRPRERRAVARILVELIRSHLLLDSPSSSETKKVA